ncbi:MAG: fibronectin type III domain-containing protein [Saprospiraceae bacterium]
MKHLLTLTFAVLFSSISFAQNTINYVQGEALVRLENDGSLKNILTNLQTFKNQSTEIKIERQISKHMKIWLLSFNENLPHEQFLDALYMDANIMEAQSNHTVELRNTTPNDVGFNQQWQYINTGQSGGTVGADFDAELAWDVTTGGLTPFGDTIVVAVIDEGFDISHADFGDNHWINYNEIPNNGIDDDNNGFIDDYRGWNVHQNNDVLTNGGFHGTAVAGIVGAKGDNGTGVTGVNWNVKVMMIRLTNTVEADVLEAYDYTLQNRKLYNETNGTSGAFVVATNASWGVNQGQPSNAPLWCAMYDTLGAHGILNAGATANANFNIDAVGDLPTACPSDYMISVTNINHNDQKVTQAGYGTTTIDVGAFGEGTWTIDDGGGYAGFGGTSGATPHVAGMIGLLYSVPCLSFAALSKTNPDSAALFAKQFIMDGSDPNISLNGITVSGGRMNMNGAIQEMLNNCDTNTVCFLPYNLNTTNITDTSATLNWTAFIDTITDFNVQYRMVGSSAWTTVTVSDTILSLDITGLNACETYEFQVEMACDTLLSGYSQSFIFDSDGCCTAPDGVMLTTITDTTADLSWNSVLAAQSYDLRYREVGTMTWDTITGITSTSYQLTNLMTCMAYEVEMQTVCIGSVTGFGTTFNFSSGCGACSSMPYCASEGNDVSDEWIKEVIFNTINNNSGVATSGYTDFTSISTTIGTGQSYPISLTQEYSGIVYPEYFTVWIDFDQSGTFDPAEQVYASGSTTTFPNTGNVIIPTTAALGPTRMRVSMKYNATSTACETFNFGEVEDYCVNIVTGGMPQCDVPTNISSINMSTSSTMLNWDAMPFATGYDVEYREVGASSWSTFPAINNNLLLSGLLDCTDYEYQIRTDCGNGNTSAYSSPMTFTTICNCNEVTDLDTITVNTSTATLAWSTTQNNVSYVVDYREQGALGWSFDLTTDTIHQLTNLQPATTYEAKVRIMCTGNIISNSSNVVTFYTDWTVGTENLPADIEQLSVYPNPFNESIQVIIDAINTQDITIEIFDISGKLVITTPNQNVNRGKNTLLVTTNDLNEGLYILKITTEKGVVTRRMLKK